MTRKRTNILLAARALAVAGAVPAAAQDASPSAAPPQGTASPSRFRGARSR
jgi:hypothetical protein